MSTEAEELLGELVKKIEGLEIKILAISTENKELHDMIKCIYEKNYELVKENKKAFRKTDSQSEKDAERETTGIRKETSRKDEA